MPPTTPELAVLLQSLTAPTPENASSVSQIVSAHLQTPCVEQLSRILLTHPDAPVRNLAATLLRTHQTDHLEALPADALTNVTRTLLERLSCEPHTATRRAIIALFTTLSFTDQKLVLLLPPVVAALLSSPDPSFRAQAFLLPDVTPESLQKGLQDPEASVRHEALTAYANATLLPNPGFIQLLPSALKHATSTPVTDDAFPRLNALLYEALANLLQAPEFRPHFNDAFRHAVQTFAAGPVDAAGPAVEFLVYACEKKPRTIKKAALHDIAITEACRILLTEPIDTLNSSEDEVGRESRIFLAMRVLDAIAMKPELSAAVFLQGYSTVVKSMADPDSRTLIGCFNIIAALSDGCSAEITSHAEDVVTRVLSLQFEDRMNADARAASLDALTSVTKSLDTDEMPDEVTARIAGASLASVVKGLRHQVLGVRRASCMSLESVLGLFRNGELGGRAEEVVDALAALDGGSLAVEAVLAIGVLAENASEALVASPRFQVLLRRTVELMVSTASDDSLTTAAAYEAAGALVTVCKDVDVVNRLAGHAANGLDSDDPTVKQGALSFFAHLADSVGGSSVLVYGERVLKSVIESVEQQDMFVVPDEDGTLTDMNGDDDGVRDAHVRTAYLDEKTVAVGCMGAFATAAASDEFVDKLSSLPGSGSTILALLGKSAELADILTSHFHSEIRAPAFRACCRLSSANMRMRRRKPNTGFCPVAYTDRVLSIILEGLRDDEDLWVVTDLANAFSIFLEDIPPDTIVGRKEDIIETLDLLILSKAECQTPDEDEDPQDGIGGDDVDSLMESMGDVIEALVRALRGHFAQHFTSLLEQILKTLYGPNASGRSRGMVLGTVAGVLLFMCWERCPFPPPSMNDPAYEGALSASDELAAAAVPLALEAIRSADSRTLQRNAVFLLGVIFEHTRSSNTNVWARLPVALETLQQILLAGKSGNGALVDNAAGAISRIAIARGMPQETSYNRKTMLQAALGCVPLEDDPAENTTLARAIVQAADTGFEDFMLSEMALRVVSCLVTSVLMHVDTAGNRGKSRWVRSASDPNDEMVRLDDEECGKVMKILQRVRHVVGESVFAQLRLSDQDASVLAQAMST